MIQNDSWWLQDSHLNRAAEGDLKMQAEECKL